MEGRSYFWKMAAVCVLVSAVLLTGCGGTGSPAEPDPHYLGTIHGVEFWIENVAYRTVVWDNFQFLRDNMPVEVLNNLLDGRALTKVIVTGLHTFSRADGPIVDGIVRGKFGDDGGLMAIVAGAVGKTA